MMIIREDGSDRFVLSLSRDELLILSNSVNEVCNGIDAFEFSTRLGSKREAALEILDEIARALS